MYIGTQIAAGNYRKLTNLASSFNGVTTTFTLSVPPGTSQYYVTPTSTYQLLISVGGIIQQPDVDYTISTNTITFTTAPAAGLSFFGILMGDALNIGTPSDGTVTAAKLSPAGGLSGQAFIVNGSGQFAFAYPTPGDGTVTPAKLSTTGALVGQTYVVNSSGQFAFAYAGARGGSTDQIFYENDQTVTASYTITTNKNAVTAGPVTIQSGVVVTVPSGSYWSIV